MHKALELYQARVSHVALMGDRAVVHFSVAYVHRSKGRPGRDPASVWVQEAELAFERAVLSSPLPALPNTIAEGFIDVGGIRHELIPLPFKRKGEAIFCATFADGAEFEIAGRAPVLELSGEPTLIETPD
jgi:hypothetical protein